MYNYHLKIIYDGGKFHGWQIQNIKNNSTQNPPTIQGVLEEILYKLHGEFIRIIGASRTDAGVHSYGQNANFITGKLWNCHELKKAFNSLLKPNEIIIDDINIKPINFHSRYDCQGKIYHYQIWLKEFIDPFKKNYWWVWNKSIDFNALNEGCNLIKNSSNLNGFAHWNMDLIKHYDLLDLSWELNNDQLILKFHGKGFFYNQIRYLVGHIIHYASGIIDKNNFLLPLNNPHPSTYKKILAPAHGLFLMEIFY